MHHIQNHKILIESIEYFFHLKIEINNFPLSLTVSISKRRKTCVQTVNMQIDKLCDKKLFN